MTNADAFVEQVVRAAREHGYKIESHAQSGEVQIDFGNKKLHAGHLRRIFPGVVSNADTIARLIEGAAPGRPCSHRPMREIVEQLRREGHL